VIFAGMPKLLENVLRVTDVAPRRLVVEPPPVLVRSPVDYYVYHLGDDRLRPLGQLQGTDTIRIVDERGRQMHAFQSLHVDNTGGAAKGDEVAISRIVPGRDAFHIAMRAYREW
jgi:hypothetical protein